MNNELYHYGIPGMKWGVRRYANKNGKLNAEGRKRYGVKSVDEWKIKKKQMRATKDKLENKANKKYKLDTYERYADMESSMNRQNSKFGKKLFGESYEAKTSTWHQDNYDTQRKKAKKFVDGAMKKQFGQSYETWEKNNETVANIAAGASIVAALGFIAYTSKVTK